MHKCPSLHYQVWCSILNLDILFGFCEEFFGLGQLETRLVASLHLTTFKPNACKLSGDKAIIKKKKKVCNGKTSLGFSSIMEQSVFMLDYKKEKGNRNDLAYKWLW